MELLTFWEKNVCTEFCEKKKWKIYFQNAKVLQEILFNKNPLFKIFFRVFNKFAMKSKFLKILVFQLKFLSKNIFKYSVQLIFSIVFVKTEF